MTSRLGAATLLCVVLAVLLFALTKRDVTLAGNESSRLAAVESLVDRGTSSIEGSTFTTVDKVRIDGRFYSDKPILPIAWLAAVYWIPSHALSIDFAESRETAVKIVTFFGIGSFSILLALLFFLRLRPADAPLGLRLVSSAAVVLATWIVSYGTTVNNHTPAACVVFALVWVLDSSRGRPGLAPPLLAGTLAGLLFNFDFPTGGLFALGSIAFVSTAHPSRLRATVACAAGFAALVVLMMALDLFAYGTVLPASMVPGGKDFPGNIHAVTPGGQFWPRDPPVYYFHVLFGQRGFFSCMPVLLFGLMPIAADLRSRRKDAWILGATLASVTLFYATQTGDHGGWAYGFRYLIPLIPILFWFSVRWWIEHRRQRRIWLFYAALAVSAAVSWIGVYNPWPVVYEGAGTRPGAVEERVRSPIVANLLAWSFERDPDSPLTRFLIDEVYGRELARDYLALAYLNMRRPDLVRRMKNAAPSGSRPH
jgi:hypothetical protein